MSATESVRTNREQIKSHRQSSLIQGNVVAFVFRSIDLQSISSSSPRTILSSSSYSKDESQKDDELIQKPEQLLQAFIDANKDSLNRKLVESFNELRIFGWYSSYTLLLSGPSEDVEVLKKAWSQRILRNPKGFLLKDVGIVKDFVVDWIPHSQFISLTTALHDTVVELDRNGMCASRDSIIKYLKNVYHDVRIPTEDIIHKCLGRLIEQRKIYHDGVGYRALIDNSPIHKPKRQEKAREELEEALSKCPAKSSVKTKGDNGSAGSGSVASKDLKSKSSRKFALSDGSSKDETTSRAHSDEDRTRFNLPFFEHFTNSSTPTMRAKVPKNKKKKLPLVINSGKSSVSGENREDQEIKIIDISERMSVLRHNNSLDVKSIKEAAMQVRGLKNGELSHNPDAANNKSPSEPYDKHCREAKPAKPTKRVKPQRSRSFTDPSKHRVRNKNAKGVGSDGDFPLRRVMRTEELRSFSKADLTEGSKIDSKSDKGKYGKDDRNKMDKNHKTSHIHQSSRHFSARKSPLVDKIIAENGSRNNFDEKKGTSPASVKSIKSMKLTTDSDTPSGSYASDASSPLQSKKRKDLIKTFPENNNLFGNGMTCLCLTGKLRDDSLNVGNEDPAMENTLKRGSNIGKEKLDVNIEHDSIFDYVDNESNGFDYQCEDDVGIENCNLDSIPIGCSI